jgi:hypothetical protein
MKTAAISAVLLLGAMPIGWSADTPPEIRLTPTEIAALAKATGGVGTSGLPAVTMTVLYGNPAQSGLYTIELKIAPSTTIQAHTHKDTRTATVVSGLWYFGY